jgi:hypothetical protein
MPALVWHNFLQLKGKAIMKKLLSVLSIIFTLWVPSFAQNYYKVDSLPKSDSAYHKNRKDTLYTPKKDSTKYQNNNKLSPNPWRREKTGKDTLRKDNVR